MLTHESQTTSDVRRPTALTGKRRTWIGVPIGLGVLALAAACTPYGSSNTASTASAPTSLPAGSVVTAAPTGLGTILVNADGRTVYEFANDTSSMSTCNGGCAQTWLPVAAPDVPLTSVPGLPAKAGVTTRSDGTHQLTVAGHPLYTFAGDNAAGQTNGQGITLNGGLWTVVSPKGQPVAAGSSSMSTGY